jgi:hypothetical protein
VLLPVDAAVVHDPVRPGRQMCDQALQVMAFVRHIVMRVLPGGPQLKLASGQVGHGELGVALKLDQLGGLQQLTSECKVGDPHRDPEKVVKLIAVPVADRSFPARSGTNVARHLDANYRRVPSRAGPGRWPAVSAVSRASGYPLALLGVLLYGPATGEVVE